MGLIERFAIHVAQHHVLQHLINAKGMAPQDAAQLVASAPVTSVSSFLTWVVQNAPEIYAVVSLVLSMFGIVLPPIPFPVPKAQ